MTSHFYHVRRLTGVTNSPNMTASYTYNSLGNITVKDGQSYTYGTGGRPHQPTQVGSTPLQYDSNGNAYQGSTGQLYTFDRDDHLTSINVSGGPVNFLYDYRGRRVAKLVGASITRYYNDLLEGTDGQLTKYYFIGGVRVAAQRINSSVYAMVPDAAVQVAAISGARPAMVLLLRRDAQFGVALSVIVLGSGLLLAPWRRKRVVGVAVRHGQVILVVLAFSFSTFPWPLLLRPLGPAAAEAQTPPLLVHFHLDHLGSTQLVTDSGGNIFRHVRYRAYGEVRRYTAGLVLVSDCGTDRYCHEFTGYDTEPISGLDYAGARVYDSGLGMFLSHDPAAQFASPYIYGGGNPVNGTDPTGALFGIDDAVLAVSLLIANFTASTIQAAVNGASAGEALKAGFTSVALSVVTGIGLGAIEGAVGSNLAPALHAVELAAGTYSTVQGFRSGQYAVSSFGVVVAALGGYGLIQDVDSGRAQHGGVSDTIDAKLRGHAPTEQEEVTIHRGIERIRNVGLRSMMLQKLQSGEILTYEPLLGNANAVSFRGGTIYLSSPRLGNSEFGLGVTLGHEQFHIFAYGQGTNGGSEIHAEFYGYSLGRNSLLSDVDPFSFYKQVDSGVFDKSPLMNRIRSEFEKEGISQ